MRLRQYMLLKADVIEWPLQFEDRTSGYQKSGMLVKESLIYPCKILILLMMAVQGFRNLIRAPIFSDDSFQPLLRKSDQYRKVAQVALLHFENIVKNFQTFQNSYQNLIVDYEEDIEISEINVPQYLQKYVQLFRNIWSEQKCFNDKLTNNVKELTALCDSLFSNFSSTIFNFQNYVRNYKAHEQVLMELSKKYFRTHKTMMGSIDLYKATFTDVKIIYNMDEKKKRYGICEGHYKALQEELDNIDQKVVQLSDEKDQIIEAYKDIDKEFTLTLKAVGSKLIAMSRSFVFDFCQMEKIIITYLAEKKFTLEKVELKTFFTSDSKLQLSDYFDVEIDPKRLQFYPAFVVYHKNIKEEHYSQFGKLLTGVIKQTDEKIENRKRLSRKVLEFTSSFFKIYEKGYYFGLKQVFGNFEKVKKKLSEIFGARLCSFLKSINSIFELSIGINEKLIKRTMAKLKSVEVHVIEEIKILDLFQKEFKSNIETFAQKQNIKRMVNGEKDVSQFTEEEPTANDVDTFKSSISEKADHLAMLIDGFVDKLKKNYDQLKFHYNAIVNDISVSTNEFYSLCCEYQELYFGDDEFIKNYKKYESDIDAALDVQRKFFKEINFGALLQDDSGKIIFDSETNKTDQFKKLKKPMLIEVDHSHHEKEKVLDPKHRLSLPEGGSQGFILEDVNSSTEKKVEKKQNLSKHQQFLESKINFLPDEKFVKSFSCALSDKILLSGRVYITNKRICFHSSFNPNNIFFGDTFLQIPKNDIKKIQKRLNAIVFDNSISITTVNGEVFLTSFFSRNQAYNLMCQALQIDTDEFMFEPETMNEEIKLEAEVQSIPEVDDMADGDATQREEKIKKMLGAYPYKEMVKTEFAYPGFNAYKFLKVLDVGGEITINRKTFKNFAVYIKECLEHKEYVYGDWSPSSPADFLNPVNIKTTTPLSFTRKISCMVPVKNSGVPFMPKQAKSEEIQTFYIISKDKYILQSSIQNSGIPYADVFNLKLLRVIETINENCCQMTVSLYINFLSNTMMKGIIQSKSTEQTKGAMLRMQAQAKKYLSFLERTKLKAKAHQTTAQSVHPNQNNNEQYQKEIAELKESEQKLQNEVKVYRIKLDQGTKILLGSIVLNVLLILILLA